MQFFEELKRRNVIRVGIAYLVGAWLIIQVAETLFPVYGLSDGAIRLVVTLLAIGLLPVLIFAWVFERTNEGIKRQRDVDRSDSITANTGRRLDRAIIVVLVLALGYFAVDKFVLRGGPPGLPAMAERSPALEGWENRSVAADRKSIAVLPFANMSGDPANEPFTLGIHDDLLTHLSRIGSLKTTSRTSVLQYRDTTKSVPEIGAELDVSYILEGGIQRSGDRVRINMQLIDVATDEHLWAEIYDRQLTAENLFAVQGEVAEEVAGQLEATLLPAEQTALSVAPTTSMAAYDLYILGRHHQHTRTAESLGRSVDYFSRAIEEDPGYVLAYAGLAQSRLLLVGYGNLAGEDVLPEAREILDQALELDDSEAEVWAAEGLYHYNSNQNTPALEALERAIELDIQNYHAWLWYSIALGRARRFEEQLEALQVAYSLEPMSYPVNNNIAYLYRARGDFARARQHFERVEQIDAQNRSEWGEQIARDYLHGGELARAVATAREVLAVDPTNDDAMELLVDSYIELDQLVEAEQWADEAQRQDGFGIPAYRLYMVRGDFDGVLLMLEDKRATQQAQGDEYIYEAFQAAYYGGQVESARGYLNRWLTNRGDRFEVSPYNTWHWDALLVADFLIRHGEGSPGGPARGRQMLAEVERLLLELRRQGYQHPHTLVGLAMSQAMSGDKSAALETLSQAMDRGFSSRYQLALSPQLDGIREEPQFSELSLRLDGQLAEQASLLADTRLAPFEPAAERERVVLAPEVLRSYTGYYTDDNIMVRAFINEAGQLMGQLANQVPIELVPVSEREFYVEGARAVAVEFVLDESGRVTHALVDDSGNVDRLKVTDPPPETIELGAEALGAFTGSWISTRDVGGGTAASDVDVWIAEISVDEDGQLWIDFDNQPALPLDAIDESTFIIPGFTGRFSFERVAGADGYNRLIASQQGADLVFERKPDP